MLKGRMNPEEYDYKPMEQITQTLKIGFIVWKTWPRKLPLGEKNG